MSSDLFRDPLTFLDLPRSTAFFRRRHRYPGHPVRMRTWADPLRAENGSERGSPRIGSDARVDASTPSMIYLRVQSVPNRPRQGAVRREWRALYKDCNAELAYLGHSLRASQEAVICVVALP